jgi:hypothetical protein
MIIEINPNWGYIIPILVLMAINIYQAKKIDELTKEVSEIWHQIGLLALSITNKFVEIDGNSAKLREIVEVKKTK